MSTDYDDEYWQSTLMTKEEYAKWRLTELPQILNLSPNEISAHLVDSINMFAQAVFPGRTYQQVRLERLSNWSQQQVKGLYLAERAMEALSLLQSWQEQNEYENTRPLSLLGRHSLNGLLTNMYSYQWALALSSFTVACIYA